jgi:hypothetical protein
MKKLLFGVFCAVLVVCMLSIAGCRTRVASAPGPEPTATLTGTATMFMTPTITPTSAPFSLTFDFEGSLNGWVLGGDPGFTIVNDVAASSVPGGTVISGSHCAAVTCNFSGSNVAGEFEFYPSQPDFSAASVITAHVYIPADLPAGYSVQVLILTLPGYVFKGQNYPSLTVGAWNTVSLNIVGATYINDVNRVSIQLLKNSGADWSGTIYVDDVTVN